MEENEQTLEERFLKIEQEQKEQIEKLKQEISKRDNIITKFMTRPSNQKSEIENENENETEDDEKSFTSEDVKKVLKIIESKRR